jgi:trimeric autotransporter adhesin
MMSSRFQIRFNPGNPWLKNSAVSKFFGNFVPNFREQIADDKHPNAKAKPKTKRKTPMKQTLLGTSPNHMKRKLSKVATALLFTSCLALLPKAQAVTPKPGGGYPGGNTAAGQDALFSLNSGGYNTALGWSSLRSDTTNSFNTAIGAGALFANAADGNTATGTAALLSNTTGAENTANGAFALVSNTTGGYNTAGGFQSLFSNTTGNYNTAYGDQALLNNTVGADNTAIGRLTLAANTTGIYNTATGSGALSNNTEGVNNTASGFHALFYNTTGAGNTAGGFYALHENTTGGANTAYGQGTLQNNTTGLNNTAVGYGALNTNNASWNTAIGLNALAATTTGGENTATGANALHFNTTGFRNVAIGSAALHFNTAGSHNVGLGYIAGGQQHTGSRNVYIGYDMQGVDGENDSCYISSIFGQTSSGGSPVYINSAGKLGTTTSSRRFKEDIKPMNDASEALFALKPVTFRYKKEIDSQGIPQFGLIAEEVEKVNPDLVVRDKEGKVNSVRYEQINAMLLNEFLKEHKKVEQQQATIAELKSTVAQQQKGMEILSAQLKEHAAQIQKVGAQIGVSRPASRVASNP